MCVREKGTQTSATVAATFVDVLHSRRMPQKKRAGARENRGRHGDRYCCEDKPPAVPVADDRRQHSGRQRAEHERADDGLCPEKRVIVLRHDGIGSADIDRDPYLNVNLSGESPDYRIRL